MNPQNTINVLLKTGRTYRSKKPKSVSINDGLYVDDRQIVWEDGIRVQYDSPTISIGKKLPIVLRTKFLQWVGSDVTSEVSKTEWTLWSKYKDSLLK